MDMLNDIDLSRADLNLLVLFEAVMAERHVAKTARRLNLSPSAVSHGLGRLRKMLGDPLFLKTPRGVVPTDRASLLAPQIADILRSVRSVVGASEAFDPAKSKRRFVVKAPDAVSSVFLPRLLETLRKTAPGIDIGIGQLLPRKGDTYPAIAWADLFEDLDAHRMDAAVVPLEQFPARFAARLVYEEDFVIAARADHPFHRQPSLENYCAMQHVVVSESADPNGFVDQILAKQGLSRRVAVTVPNAMFALALLPGSNYVSALPRHFAEIHRAQFGIRASEAPLPLGRFQLNLVVPRVALKDAGIAWLADTLVPPQRKRTAIKTRARQRAAHSSP
jgi:DNA-binding transcriptional LysR family regulator